MYCSLNNYLKAENIINSHLESNSYTDFITRFNNFGNSFQNLKNKNFEKQICAENLSYEDVLKLLDYDKYFTLTKQNLPSETKKFVEKLSEDNLVKIQDN